MSTNSSDNAQPWFVDFQDVWLAYNDELLKANNMSWKQALVIEINYSIENHKINCDLLLVIAEHSISGLTEKLNYLLD